MKKIKAILQRYPKIKQLIHAMLVQHKRPTWIARWLVNPWSHRSAGKVRSTARMDVFPFQEFELGKGSVIEDFAVVNNGIGAVKIGESSRMGIGSVAIGPVQIGNNCLLAQHVVISGLNHHYQDIKKPIGEQGVYGLPVRIEDNCWIGANVSILSGVTIGKHSVIGAGSVVTADVPAYHVAVGNPARLVKKYDHRLRAWVRLDCQTKKVSEYTQSMSILI